MSRKKTPGDKKKRTLTADDIETTASVGRRSALAMIGGTIAGTVALTAGSRPAHADQDREIPGDPVGKGTDKDKGPNEDAPGRGSDDDLSTPADPAESGGPEADSVDGDPIGEGTDEDEGLAADQIGEGSDEDEGTFSDLIGEGSDNDGDLSSLFTDPFPSSDTD